MSSLLQLEQAFQCYCSYSIYYRMKHHSPLNPQNVQSNALFFPLSILLVHVSQLLSMFFFVNKKGIPFERGEYCNFYEAKACIANYCATWFHMRLVPPCARCKCTCACVRLCAAVWVRAIEWMSEFAFYAIRYAFTNIVCMPQTTVTLNIRNIIMLLDSIWICVSLLLSLSPSLSPCVCMSVFVCDRKKK